MGLGGQIVDVCISHVWAVIAENKGVVVQTEGDLVRAFFDSDQHEQPPLVALRTTDKILGKLRSIATQFIEAHSLANDFHLEFRAAIASGAIKPIWTEVDTIRYPGWTEAGSSNVFVDTTRMMDLEHRLPTKSTVIETRVLLREELAGALCRLEPSLALRFTARNLDLRGKHGREYRVAFYLPDDGLRQRTKKAA